MRKLKKQPGKDICVMGGGELAHSLFEAGLIDEVGFNIHPVLLGSGIPLFHPMKRQIDLEFARLQALQERLRLCYLPRKELRTGRGRRGDSSAYGTGNS